MDLNGEHPYSSNPSNNDGQRPKRNRTMSRKAVEAFETELHTRKRKKREEVNPEGMREGNMEGDQNLVPFIAPPSFQARESSSNSGSSQIERKLDLLLMGLGAPNTHLAQLVVGLGTGMSNILGEMEGNLYAQAQNQSETNERMDDFASRLEESRNDVQNLQALMLTMNEKLDIVLAHAESSGVKKGEKEKDKESKIIYKSRSGGAGGKDGRDIGSESN